VIGVEFHAPSAFVTGAIIAQAAGVIPERVGRVVRHHGQLLTTRVKARASGRPGPNAPTGDYRRSITHSHVETVGTYSSYVGTNRPQGRRLEFGFVGVDSLGRHYNQPPYPHFEPAAEETQGPFIDDVRRAVAL
jgi:hypothetical protein